MKKLSRLLISVALLAVLALLLFARAGVGAAEQPSMERSSALSSSISPRLQSSSPFAAFDAWAKAYATAGTEAKAALLQEGEALAKARRAEMLKLMKSDPKQALDNTLPYRLRKGLPDAIGALLEQPISGRGKLSVRAVSHLPRGQGDHPQIQREVTLNGQTYEAYVYGRRLGQVTRNGLAFHGVVLDHVLAVHSDPGRVLDAEEAQAAIASGRAKADAKCAFCGKAAASLGKQTLVDLGGQIQQFCSGSHAVKSLEVVASAEKSPMPQDIPGAGPNPTNPPPNPVVTFTQGRRTLLFIRVSFQDDPTEPITQSAAYQLMEGVNQFYVDNSYNTLSLATTVTPVFQLPQPSAYYASLGQLQIDAWEAAKAAGFYYLDYDLDIVAFAPGAFFGSGGSGNIGARGIVLSYFGSVGFVASQLGNNFGLISADLWNTGWRPIIPPGRPPNPNAPGANFPIDNDSYIGHDAVNAPGQDSIYADPWSTMGGGDGGNGLQFNALEKAQLNWLSPRYVNAVTASSTNRLYAFDTPSLTAGRNYALTMYKDNDRTYWASYRQLIPSNPWLANGVELHWAPWAQSYGSSMLIDTTPGSINPAGGADVNDAAVIVGRTYADPPANLYITPVAKGGVAPEQWIDVVVQIGPFPTNQPPTLSLSADSTAVPNGGTVTFTAQAQDPDGDPLAYNWDFGDGTFGSNLPVNSRTYPAAGNYVVRCEVSDMKGGVASALVVVTVGNPTTFVMSGQVIDMLGNPVQGMRVHNGLRNGNYAVALTDSHGNYAIGNQPAGTYTIDSFLYGYQTTAGFFDPVGLSGADAANLDFFASPIPTVSATVSSNAFEAGPIDGVFTITRTGDTNNDLTVFYTLSGTAIPDVEYMTPLDNTVVIPAGSYSADLNITPIDDTTGLGPDTVKLQLQLAATEMRVHNVLTNGTNLITVTNLVTFPGYELLPINGQQTWFQTYPLYVLGQAEATMTIVEATTPPAPAQVNLVVLDDAAMESGEDSAAVMFWRTGTTESDLVVNYSVSGTASNGVDYQYLPGSITIPAGQTNAILSIIAIDDLLVEGNESVIIDIVEDPSYVLGTNFEATAYIVDNDLPLVTVVPTDSIATEQGPTPGTFTISRDGDFSVPLLVNYLVTGTAINGVDFTGLSGSVIIPASQVTATVVVTPLTDTLLEGVETVTMFISSSPTYNIGTPNSATIFIQDAAQPTVTIAATTGTVAEGGASGVFTVTRTGPVTNSLLVGFMVGGTAIESVDYAAISTNVVIPAGTNSARITITPIDDNFRELTETVIVQLLSSTNYNLGGSTVATVSITDNDGGKLPAVGFLLRTSTVKESAGFADIAVAISENPDASKSPAVVEYHITGGTAINGVDYSLASTGSLSFTHITGFYDFASLIATIRIPLTNDMLLESNNDTIILTLFDPHLYTTNRTNGTITAVPTNAFLGNYTTHILTIVDDDLSVVTIGVTNPFAYEAGQIPSAFLISRTGPTNAPLGVNFEVTGTASERTDYLPLGTSVTIPAGASSVLLPLVPVDDNVEEYAETVIVNLLSAPGAHIGTNGTNATIIIVDNDGTIEFTSARYTFNEGVGTALIGVQRTGDTNLLLSVDYLISDGTATSGLDYAGSNGRLIFAPGEVFQTFPIQIIDDILVEPVETVSLALTNPTGGVPLGGQSSATVFIIDNDTGFVFATNNFRVNENGTNAVISINRVGLTNADVTVTFWTSDGTATNGSDYVGVTTNVTFAAGITNQTVLIPIIDDALFEGDETVLLNLTNSVAGSPVGGSSTAQLTIVDDECALQFASATYMTNEYAGFVSVVVQRVGGTVNPVSVDFQTIDGTANSTDPNYPDYIARLGTLYFQGDQYLLATNGSGLLEFHPGETNQTVLISIVDDTIGEGNETFSVALSNPVGPAAPVSFANSTVLGSPSNTVVTIIDNETPGNVDYEFNTGVGANDRVLAVALQSDLKTVFGGDFTTVDNISFNRISRLQPSGVLDTTFNPGSGMNASVYCVAIQSDGKILVGGAFTTVNGTGRVRIARLNGDGSLDLGFNPGSGASGVVRAIAVQSDGKVLIGGDFTNVNAVARSRIARLNADGSVDASFNASINNSVNALAIQSDGNILAGGAFSNIGGTARNGIARLGTSGAVDTTFNPGGGAIGAVNTLAVQTDGRVLLGGAFALFNGVPSYNLIRLLSSGAVDTSFNPGTGANGAINSLGLQANGKMVIGGLFSLYNGVSRSRFARVKANGSLDAVFNPGTGADGAVNAVAVQPDTAVILGGDFTQINGLPRNHIARIHGDEKASLITVEFASATFVVWETNLAATITVQRSGNTNLPFTVSYFTTDGTASNGLDYIGLTNQFDFAAGETNKTFTIPVFYDALAEGDETVNLFLTNTAPNVDLSGQSTATLLILDAERFVQFAGTNYFVDEGATNAVITLTRTGGLYGPVTVTFATAGGTATPSLDYSNVNTVVTFADNQATQTVLIPIVDDLLPELAETVGLSLSNPVGARLGARAQATLTIVDNDLVYGTNTYTNSNLINILDAQPAFPYPSVINVSNLLGVVSKVTITLNNLSHTFPSDIDALLVGPQGQSVLFMSDAGGSTPVSGITLRFDDAASNFLPQAGPLMTGTNKPTNYTDPPPNNLDTFYSPAPPGPYGAALSALNGADPNGAWSLYVVDDRGNNVGSIANGWRLSITTLDPAKTNDLALSMNGSTNPVMAGQILSYVLFVTNNGPRIATGVSLSDTLPSGLILDFMKYSQGSCVYSNGTILCDVGTIAVGGFATVSLIVVPTTAASITNTATVTARESDVSPLNNVASVMTTVIPSAIADLALSMTNAPNPVLTGQNLTYTLTVTNKGPLVATGVWLTNTLPDNIKVISAAVTQGSYLSAGNQLLFNLGSMATGAVAVATVVVQTATPGALTNMAMVVDDQLDLTPDNTAVNVTTVHAGADVGVSMINAVDPVAPSGNAIYLLTVFNAGPDAAHGVTLFDTLPTQFSFVSASSSQGSNVNASGIVIFDFGTIGVGSNATATVTAKASPFAGVFTNSVTVLAVEGDPNPANNGAVVVTTVAASGGGGSGNGIIVVRNTNAAALAAAVVGSGSGLNVTSSSLIAHTLSSGEASSGLYFIGTPPLTYGLTVPGIILSSGDVLAYQTGTNISSSTTTAYSVPATPAQQQLLDPITASGPNHFKSWDATELDIHFNMQPGYDHVTFHVVFGSEEYPEYVNSIFIDGFGIFLNGSNIAYVAGSPVNINHPAMAAIAGTELDGVLAPGGNPILTFTAPVVSGSQNNTLTFIVADTSDPSLDTTVYVSSLAGVLGAHADLAMGMTATPNPVVFGSNVTYQIGVTNRGPDTSTNVVVMDVLPPGLNYLGATASQGSCTLNTGVVTCVLGNLPAGAIGQITLLGAAATTDQITNVVTVSADVADQAPGNNVASNVVTVIELGSFSNVLPIDILDASPADPYPSVIHIANLAGTVTKVTATLSGLSHTYPADLEILLVGPHGQNVVLMSDVGGGFPLNGVKLKFDDDVPNSLPVSSQIVGGAYKPTRNSAHNDYFYAPAPGGPYGTALSVFNGTDPNGNWSLYIVDDQGLDSGFLATGWRLNVSAAVAPVLQIQSIGGQWVISWPGTLSGYVLESRTTLSGAWNTVVGTPLLIGGRYTLPITLSGSSQFYRLRQ